MYENLKFICIRTHKNFIKRIDRLRFDVTTIEVKKKKKKI